MGRILAIFFKKKGNFCQKFEAVSPFKKKRKDWYYDSGHGNNGPGFCPAPCDDWRRRAANREETHRERARAEETKFASLLPELVATCATNPSSGVVVCWCK
jgi:hypothetical protein